MNRSMVRKKKKRKKWRSIGCFFILILLVIGSYGAYLTYKLASASYMTQEDLERGEKSDLRQVAIDPSKNHFSVLFIGVDARPGESKSRSDALILATFNKDDSSIKMVSIPRDSRVEIPDRGLDKINHAHFFGGKDLTVETVENLFEIPVDYYVELNFDAFIEIVDAIGGIEIDSPKAFTEQNSEGVKNAIQIEEGKQIVNGEEALAYVRMRKQDPLGDIGRGQRQQEVIKAILEKSASLSAITKYDEIIDSIGNNLQTNFSISNILALQKYTSSIDDIESMTLKGSNLTLNNVYYYSLDEESVESISSTLSEHLEIN